VQTSQAQASNEPSHSHGRNARVRATRLEDYEQISTLESRYGLESRSIEDWAHLWYANPAYLGCGSDWNIGWVLEDGDGRIVGSIGNIPLWYHFEGEKLLAATARGWVADPEYRSASLLLLDRVINQPGVDLYLNSTAGTVSIQPLEFFNCPRVPSGLWDQSVFWVTNHHGFFESYLKTKSSPIAGALAYPLAAAAVVRDRLLGVKPPVATAEVTLSPQFDERFDVFWKQLKQTLPHVLLAERSRESLNWHFKCALQNRRLWIATVMDGPRLSAYAIFIRTDNPAIGLKRIRLVDFQSLDGSTDLLETVLAWAQRACKEEGIHMLEHVGRWLEDGEFIEMLAPRRRRLATWTFYYRANYPRLAERLLAKSAWAPSLLDGDATV
jgi:hypothetical protein